MTKIYSLDLFTKIIADLKKENKTIVLTGGCFDILHFGHIRFLREASSYGNILVIALESDANVKKLKGNNRPFHNQTERAQILSELSSVDYIVLLPPMNSDKEYESMVKRISPTSIAVTEGDTLLEVKKKHAQKIGARVQVVAKIKTQSTSELAKLLGLD